MGFDRRNFIKTTLASAAVAAGSSALAACSGNKANAATCSAETKGCCKDKAKLKLSFQEGTAPGENLNQKFDYMEQMGIVGFEPGGREIGRAHV